MSNIIITEAKTQQPLIQQRANSFVRGFDYTLASYSGCAYGCSYCYVPDVQHGLPMKRGGWGTYVDVRSRSIDLLQRQANRLSGASIFLSATTDPYQPCEAKELLTRRMLEILADTDFAFLLISTRSGLVLRDLDIFTDARMRHRVEIGLSIPSDLTKAHEELEPRTAPFAGRFATVRRLREAGIATRVHAAPLALCTQFFVPKVGDAADWLWVDGAGHGARKTPRGQYWLSSYNVAESFAVEAAQQLGQSRVGFGRDRFAWRWSPVQNQITPPVRGEK